MAGGPGCRRPPGARHLTSVPGAGTARAPNDAGACPRPRRQSLGVARHQPRGPCAVQGSRTRPRRARALRGPVPRTPGGSGAHPLPEPPLEQVSPGHGTVHRRRAHAGRRPRRPRVPGGARPAGAAAPVALATAAPPPRLRRTRWGGACSPSPAQPGAAGDRGVPPCGLRAPRPRLPGAPCSPPTPACRPRPRRVGPRARAAAPTPGLGEQPGAVPGRGEALRGEGLGEQSRGGDSLQDRPRVAAERPGHAPPRTASEEGG